jgi:hypothetical protein
MIRDGTAIVAVKPDILIVVKDILSARPTFEKENIIETIIGVGRESGGIEEHPVVNQLLAELSASWGIVMTSSPDIVAYNTGLHESASEIILPPSIAQSYEDIVDTTLAPLPWDIMAIGFSNTGSATDLLLAYHYPEGGITPGEMDIAKTALSEPGSFIWRRLQLQDILLLSNVVVGDDLLTVSATTEYSDFLGSIMEGMNRQSNNEIGGRAE